MIKYFVQNLVQAKKEGFTYKHLRKDLNPRAAKHSENRINT